MSLTQGLVIYDAVSGQIRRMIVADDDADYARFHVQTVGVGELSILLPLPQLDLQTAQAAVNAVAGIVAPPQ